MKNQIHQNFSYLFYWSLTDYHLQFSTNFNYNYENILVISCSGSVCSNYRIFFFCSHFYNCRYKLSFLLTSASACNILYMHAKVFLLQKQFDFHFILLFFICNIQHMLFEFFVVCKCFFVSKFIKKNILLIFLQLPHHIHQ